MEPPEKHRFLHIYTTIPYDIKSIEKDKKEA